TCGQLQRVGPVPRGSVAKCARCRFDIYQRKPDSRIRTLAFALGALILYFPANIFPISDTHYWGAFEATTLFDGVSHLFQQGNYYVASLVFCTSILTPGLKIIGLLFLGLTLNRPGWEKFRTWTYRIIQIIDPWNMLEVTLLAILVAVAELGQVATV